VLKRIALVTAAALAVAGLAPSSADASRKLMVGIFDESVTFANPDWAFTQYRLARIKVLRVNLYWGGPAGVARRRPANALDPADPAYAWKRYDDLVKRAAESRIKIVFSIVATPGWANGGKAINRAPRKMLDLRNFAFAAAKRYSGTYRPPPPVGTQRKSEIVLPLPAVHHWMAWNEPNNPVFLRPQFVRRGRKYRLNSPRLYAQICNVIYAGVHMTRFAGQKVACGVTSPTGNNSGRLRRPSVSPIFFLRGMKRARARFDAYAHHPYYGHRSETPNTRPKGPSAVRLGNINDLARELTRLYGRKRIWVTEYAYQTKPERKFAVSFAAQARYVAIAFAKARRHPRIDMMLWFMLRDDRRLSPGWQSGFFTLSGRPKPSWRTFRRLRK
jgi:hypothetical protein